MAWWMAAGCRAFPRVIARITRSPGCSVAHTHGAAVKERDVEPGKHLLGDLLLHFEAGHVVVQGDAADHRGRNAGALADQPDDGAGIGAVAMTDVDLEPAHGTVIVRPMGRGARAAGPRSGWRMRGWGI